MTSLQVSKLTMMRKAGSSYDNIASVLGLTKDAVKKYCQRHEIKKEDITIKEGFCPICGEKLTHIQGKKQKRFCSDACRYRWWNIYRRQGGSNDSL